MPGAFDFRSARTFALEAIARLEEIGLPPTPENLTIWYSYLSGQNPALVKALDDTVSKGDISSEAHTDMFQQFFAGGGTVRQIEQAGEKVQASIESIMGQLRTANDGASGYSKRLATFSGDLADADDNEQAAELVRKMLVETREAIERNAALEAKLDKSSGEIDALRGSLEEIRKEACTDSLTKLFNRRAFDEILIDEIQASEQFGTPLSLILLDIDHFKSFNDTYGHRVGDEVLRVVGKTLNGGVHDDHTAARYGGEEFAIILPSTGIKGASELAERLRRAIAGKVLKSARTGEPFRKITASFGIAIYDKGERPGSLIQRADERLYEAKRLGRDRVVTESELAERELAS